MLNLPVSAARRRPSLTPMIDVVVLLLVFFMLVARFGTAQTIPLRLGAGTGADYDGPPRLVTVLPDSVLLNGRPVTDPAEALGPLMTAPGDMVVLQPEDGVLTERLAAVIAELRAAGLTTLAILEARP